MSRELSKIPVIGTCPSCRREVHANYSINSFDFHIIDIRSIDASWLLQGKGKIEKNITHVLGINAAFNCDLCGALFRSLVYTIPITCAPFPCPQCGEQENLEYTIQHIATKGDSFTFEAKISCKKCGNKKTLKNIIQKIFEVVNISVGPTGITVSKS